MFKILLSSTNQAKNQAVQIFFESQKIEFQLECVDVNSGVAKTPNTDDEGIIGCLNRIVESKQLAKADLYVGMEGIITTNQFGTFLCGWVVIQNTIGKNFFGCSAKCRIPPFIADRIETFGELSTLVKNTYPSELVSKIDTIGTNGVITSNLYNRVDEFQDALACAFGYYQNDSNYNSPN